MATSPKNKLDYFDARDQVHPLNTFYEGEENFDGILTDGRRYTDIFFLIVFLLLNGVLVYYSQTVIRQSDWRRLYFGEDFRTDFCGHNQLLNETHLYFYDPESVGAIGICMTACPPADGVDVCFYSQTNNQSLDDYCYKTYATSAVGYYCMPLDMKSVKRKIIETETRSTFSTMKQFAGDIWVLKDLICIGFGINLVVGILFSSSFLIKKPNAIVAFMVIFFLMGFGMVGWMIYLTTQDEDRSLKKYCQNGSSSGGCQQDYIFFIYVLRLAMLGIMGFFFLAMIMYGRRTKKIAKYLSFFNDFVKMATLFLFLIANFLAEVAFILYALFLFVSVMSSGQVQTVDAPKLFPSPQYRKLIVDDVNVYGLIFVGVMCYWWIMAFTNFNRFVLTGAISTYYFSKAKQILNKPVSRGVKLGLMNNLGSILYCSFLLPIVWPIRAAFFRIKQIFIKTLDKTTKRFRFCLAFWTPCIMIHEARLKFLRTRNLIHVTIFGDDFYRAGQRLFYLRLRNLSRIEAFRKNLGFVTFIGNIFIASSGSCFIFTYITYYTETFLGEKIDQVEYLFSIPFIVFFCGIFIANNLGNVFDHLTETILICFIADEEMFTGRHRFAEEHFRKFMDLFGQESDDVRNIANTKVNPFKNDKENEVVKYEPIIPANNNPNVQASMIKSDNNFMSFLKLNNMEPDDGEKVRKFERVYDPINNTYKVHAQLITKPQIVDENEEDEEGEEEDMEKSLRTNHEEKKSNETPVMSATGSQNRLPTPSKQQQQPRLATPLIQTNNAPNQQDPILIHSLSNFPSGENQGKSQVFFNSPQRPSSNSQNVLNVENRPNSKDKSTMMMNRPNSKDKSTANMNMYNSKNDLKVEDISRPGSSNKQQDALNNSRDRSFVEIKKMEIEDLENSYASSEEEEEKADRSINLTKGNERKAEATKLKNEEKSNNFLDSFNNKFNIDQKKNKSNNNSILGKDNSYHF